MALSKVHGWARECWLSVGEAFTDPGSNKIPVALITTAGVLGTCVLWRSWQNRHKRLPPTPRGWSIMGNTHNLTEDMHLDLIRIQKENNLPDVFMLNIGWGKKYIILNSYDAIKDAFVTQGDMFSNFQKSPSVEFMEISDDFVQKDFLDPTWRASKTFVMTALKSSGFGGSHSSQRRMLDVLQLLLEHLDAKSQESSVNMDTVLRRATASVLFQTLFNKTYDVDDPELVSRVQLVHDWYAGFLGTMAHVDFFPKWFVKIFMRGKINYLFDLSENVRKFIREEIHEHLETADPEHPRDFLDVYLTKKDGQVDIESLANTVLLLLPDGIDTIAGVVNWVVLYVTHNSEVMKRIQKEIDSVTSGNRLVTLSDRSRMTYTEAVIMEVIRVAAPVTMTGIHLPIRDCYFRGYYIPKTLSVWGNIYAALMDAHNFPSPEVFNPERFLDKDMNLINTDVWITFGLGRRRCVGEQTAKAEVFLFVANLFQRYDFSFPAENPNPPLEPRNEVLVRSPQPYEVVLKPRN